MPGDARLRADRRDLRRHSDVNEGEVLLRELRPHFHLAALGEPEERARSRADDLADLDVAGEDQAAAGATTLSWPIWRAGRAKLCLRDAHLRISGVARGLLGVDLRLGDEAAALERDGALVIRLRQRGIGPRSLDLRGELRRLLRLHRAVDDGEHLARTDPAAGIDEDPDDAAALAGDPDRLVALGGERAAGGDDCAPTWLWPGTTTVTVGICPAPAPPAAASCWPLRPMITPRRERAMRDEQRRAPTMTHRRRLARSVTTRRVGGVDRSFPVHHSLPKLAISVGAGADCITRISHLAQQEPRMV